MKNILTTIENNNLIKAKEKIGVAVSGGIDSMCLLHYLNEHKKELGIELIAINIDHSIRSVSADDSAFVKNYCKQNNINCHSFKVDALGFSKQNKLTLEEGARICRYNVFDSLISKKIVDKIAIAHHKQDQVETILLNLFRGSGLVGASGMKYISGGYIRPMLDTDKKEILIYASENNIPFVQDETNFEIEYSRNFLRQEIIPKLKTTWNNLENNLLAFSKICKQDDDYINSTINFDNIIFEKNLVKIPLSYFIYPKSVIFRILKKSFNHLKAIKDIEAKHYNIILSLAKDSENGTRINLPNSLLATKEYDYLTISFKKPKQEFITQKFSVKDIKVLNQKVQIKKVNNVSIQNSTLFFDLEKLPTNSVWRTKQTGDIFTKFSGGTKKLKDYFIDKKIPLRIRANLPLLACGNEILMILGHEINDKIKVDENSKKIYSIKIKE